MKFREICEIPRNSQNITKFGKNLTCHKLAKFMSKLRKLKQATNVPKLPGVDLGKTGR